MAKIMPLASADLKVVTNGPATGMRSMCLRRFRVSDLYVS